MSHRNFCNNRNKKITDFTTKTTRKSVEKNTLKRPISPSNTTTDERETKQQITDSSINSTAMAKNNTITSNQSFITEAEDNSVLKNALGPLINEF